MKQFAKDMVRDFCVITTLVNLVVFVLGSVFRPEQTFSYEAFLSPLIYAGVSLVPIGLTWFMKPDSKSGLLVKNIIQLALVEAALFIFGFGIHNLSRTSPWLVAGFGASIAIVYVLVCLFEWWTTSKQAEKMTLDLKAYQKREQN